LRSTSQQDVPGSLLPFPFSSNPNPPPTLLRLASFFSCRAPVTCPGSLRFSQFQNLPGHPLSAEGRPILPVVCSAPKQDRFSGKHPFLRPGPVIFYVSLAATISSAWRGQTSVCVPLPSSAGERSSSFAVQQHRSIIDPFLVPTRRAISLLRCFPTQTNGPFLFVFFFFWFQHGFLVSCLY